MPVNSASSHEPCLVLPRLTSHSTPRCTAGSSAGMIGEQPHQAPTPSATPSTRPRPMNALVGVRLRRLSPQPPSCVLDGFAATRSARVIIGSLSVERGDERSAHSTFDVP